MLNFMLTSLFITVFCLIFLTFRLLSKKVLKIDGRMHDLVAGASIPRFESKEIAVENNGQVAGKSFIPRNFLRKIEVKLVQADMLLKAKEFLYMVFLIFIVGFFVFFLFSENLYIALVLAIFFCYLPFFYLYNRGKGRSHRFEAQFPDALILISNSLRVGYSFSTAIDLISKELRPPISTDFSRLVRDLKLGADFDDAIIAMGTRLQSRDFNLFLIAVQIQRQVGGNLTEVLDKLAATIRERDRVRGEIRTLTAQGKISGLVIGALPVVVGFGIYFINPGYILLLFSSLLGWAIVGAGLALEGFGILIIKKIVSIEA